MYEHPAYLKQRVRSTTQMRNEIKGENSACLRTADQDEWPKQDSKPAQMYIDEQLTNDYNSAVVGCPTLADLQVPLLSHPMRHRSIFISSHFIFSQSLVASALSPSDQVCNSSRRSAFPESQHADASQVVLLPNASDSRYRVFTSSVIASDCHSWKSLLNSARMNKHKRSAESIQLRTTSDLHLDGDMGVAGVL